MKRVLFKIGFLQIPFLCATVMAQAQQAPASDTAGAAEIEEVVVTAYGIKKDRKALGYVFQDIKGSDVVEARELNVTDAMVGKVSGLQLVKSTAGPAGSSKIILRGYNSLTGDNQPLIVVDGMPMDNFLGQSNNDFWNASLDMGNGLSDLNPEDIENITVLKGGAASALYGSRAGNGVIMITTKQGKKNKGAGIVYSNTVNIATMMQKPETQKIFSQGTNGGFGKNSSSSWGAKIAGQDVEFWDGTTGPLRSYNNFDSFFDTGIAENNTITLQQALSESTSVFSSFSYMTDKGIVPNTRYNRLNAMTRINSTFGENEKWHSDVKVQYINSEAKNRPIGGHDSGYYGGIIMLPSTVDLASFKEGMKDHGAVGTWYTDPTSKSNPWWRIYNQLNSDVRNRFMMNASLQYDFTDWLDMKVQAGSDYYNTKSEGRVWTGGPLNNSYSTGLNKFMENNYIGSLSAHKDNFAGKWSGAISVFGQIMTRRFNSLDASAQLDIPNYFVLSNDVNGRPSIGEGRSRKQINSVFATMDLNYDNWWFLNVTGRNDWSSALSKENRSFFYPSVSTSLVLTDMFKKVWGTQPFGRVISFAKIRASYAQTGNDMGPYNLINVYNIGHDPLGNLTAWSGNTLLNPDVKSELLKTWEVGANLRIFNRVDLDINYYNTHATRQLIGLPLNPLSGYGSRMINAGDIGNEGIEIVANADILRASNFSWSTNVNFSKNKNKIYDLADGVEIYGLTGYDSVSFVAYVGRRYGVILGTKYARVEDESSPFFGKKILSAEGLPTSDRKQYVLGDQTPRALLGWTNRFRYKDLGLSFQVDGRFGGKFFAGTMNSLKDVGLAKQTVVNGEREDFVVDGVVPDGSGGFTQNTTAVSPQDYWTIVSETGNLGINEENVFNATNVRMRNIQLSYNFPKSIIGNSVFNKVAVSFSVNNAFMIYSKVPGVDPESTYNAGSNAAGFEFLSFPSRREYVINLTVGF